MRIIFLLFTLVLAAPQGRAKGEMSRTKETREEPPPPERRATNPTTEQEEVEEEQVEEQEEVEEVEQEQVITTTNQATITTSTTTTKRRRSSSSTSSAADAVATITSPSTVQTIAKQAQTPPDESQNAQTPPDESPKAQSSSPSQNAQSSSPKIGVVAGVVGCVVFAAVLGIYVFRRIGNSKESTLLLLDSTFTTMESNPVPKMNDYMETDPSLDRSQSMDPSHTPVQPVYVYQPQHAVYYPYPSNEEQYGPQQQYYAQAAPQGYVYPQ
jgi:hypothetical protein